jgi:hypothetical protein
VYYINIRKPEFCDSNQQKISTPMSNHHKNIRLLLICVIALILCTNHLINTKLLPTHMYKHSVSHIDPTMGVDDANCTVRDVDTTNEQIHATLQDLVVCVNTL